MGTLALGACSVIALLTSAPATLGIACPPKTVAIIVPFPDIPFSFEDNKIRSSIDTQGVLTVTNQGTASSEEIDIQIEYFDSQGQAIGLLWFGGTTGSPPHGYFEKLREGFAGGSSVILHAMSLRAFAACPTEARLTGIHVRFSDGRELRLVESEWVHEEFPHKIREPLFSVVALPSGDSNFLLDLTVDSDGRITHVQEVKSTPTPLPVQLSQEILKWSFHAQTRDGKPHSSSIRTILRVVRTGRNLDDVEIPFSDEELRPNFMVITLGLSSKPVAHSTEGESFEVYFGHVPFSGNAELLW